MSVVGLYTHAQPRHGCFVVDIYANLEHIRYTRTTPTSVTKIRRVERLVTRGFFDGARAAGKCPQFLLRETPVARACVEK